MPEPTPLDRAHAEMTDAPEDPAARMRFYARLVEGELFLMLARDADGSDIEPRVFPLEDGPYVLVYDREDRLARFAGGATPYAAVSGRVIAEMLAGRGIGMGINLGEAPSEMLLPPEAVAWLAETLARRPSVIDATPREVAPPHDLPEEVLTAIDARLARMEGLARQAWLAAVRYAEGGSGHLLAFVDIAPGAEDALAGAVGEALTFSGMEAAALDIVFLPADHVLTARLARVALRFDLPSPASATPRGAPGTDPDRPPRLR
jgi:hypothetical protein